MTMVIKKACREDTKKNRDRKRDNIYIEREKKHRWRDIKREKRDTGKKNKKSRKREKEMNRELDDSKDGRHRNIDGKKDKKRVKNAAIKRHHRHHLTCLLNFEWSICFIFNHEGKNE
jgi:hypothetical protein